MTITAKYPAALPTMTDYTDSGMGREKTNDKEPRHLTTNIIGPEYSQICGEVIAIAEKLGIDMSEPASYGDATLGSVDELLNWYVYRSDRAGFMDHCVFSSYTTAMIDDIGAVAAYASDADACGVADITLAAGAATGYSQATWHFRQRYTFSRYRLKFATAGTLPSGVGDTIQIGVMRDATHYSWFYSTCTNAVGPVWDDWTCEVNDGGATDSAMMTVGPVANQWRTFEVLTTATGATFWWERGTANEEKIELTAQAPENGTARPYAVMTSAAGGENFRIDMMACRDTRPL